MLSPKDIERIANAIIRKLDEREAQSHEWLTRKEAAQMLKVSVSYLAHHKDDYPGKVINGKTVYSRKGIEKLMSIA